MKCRLFNLAAAVSLRMMLAVVAGCAQEVSLRVTDADSGELLKDGSVVSRDTETWNAFRMERTVNRTLEGYMHENPSRPFTVHRNDTIFVETMGYKRCRF